MTALVSCMFASLVLLGWSVFTEGYITRDFAEALLVLSAALTCGVGLAQAVTGRRI